MMILVCMITFTFSTYFLQNWNILFKKIEKRLGFLEGEHTKYDIPLHNKKEENLSDHVIIIGGDQMGQSIVRAMEDDGENVLVIDFNPEVIEVLIRKKIPAIFGDISDLEIQERSHLEEAKLVISTVPDIEDNLLLIEALNHTNKRAKIVVMAYEKDEARELYRKGADYVVLPHIAGGRHLAKILVDKRHLQLIEEYKKKDLGALL
jgi:Trk K+ transport system NAD-binding subunit